MHQNEGRLLLRCFKKRCRGVQSILDGPVRVRDVAEEVANGSVIRFHLQCAPHVISGR